jgi:hypothetical protein
MAKSSTSFAPEQLGASADRALHFIHLAGADAPLLVEAWIKSSNAAAVQIVAELGQGAARKAARRGLNVLKARGVSVPDAPRTGRVLDTGASAREAWLLPPDSSGTEGIVLAERQPSGSYQACFVFFREGQNLLRIQSGQLGLSKIKESMQQSLGAAGYGPVDVPWGWAQYRILDRRNWHAARSVPEPLGMMSAERFLEGAPNSAPSHPFDEEGLALADEDAEKLARDSGSLHQWPEFRSWLPNDRAIQELLLRVGQRLGGESPEAKEQLPKIIKQEVAAATDRYFTPERRAVLANRMKDSGLSVLARLGEHEALQVAAVIHVIQGAGLITNPPSDVKFLTNYFDKAIALLAAQQGGQLRIPIPRATTSADDRRAEPAEDVAAEGEPQGPPSDDTSERAAEPAAASEGA